MDARDLEVRCAGCGAGFAVGTRRCIHCGQPLVARPSLDALTLQTLPTSDEAPADAADVEETAKNARRNSMLSGLVMLGLVVVSSLIRNCD
jgi:hypothetical protein